MNTAQKYGEKLRTENELDAASLRLTAAHVEVWFAVLAHLSRYAATQVMQLERLIRSWARTEWGEDAKVEFDRSARRVRVSKGDMARDFFDEAKP